MGLGIIYRAVCLATGKSYVGQTTNTLQRRVQGHVYDANRGVTTKFYNAAKKYGWSTFEWSVVHTDVPLSELVARENAAMTTFDSLRNGYNTNPSAGTSPMLVPEVAAKVSASCMGRIPWNKGDPTNCRGEKEDERRKARKEVWAEPAA